MKRTMFVVAVICCIFLLSGCTKENFTGGSVTLNVYTSFGEEDGNYDTYQTLTKQFQEEYDVVVEDHSAVSNEEWKESILSLFSSGEEPDVLFFFVGRDAEQLIEGHQVMDLDTIREIYPSYGANINSSILDTIKASDGKNYALPVSGYWEGLFINKDLFETYDIPIPDDWDSLLYTVSAFKRKDIIPIAVSLGEVPHYWFEFLIYNHTGPASHLTTIPTAENPLPKSWVDGLTDLFTLYQMGAFPHDTASITDKESFTLFQEKKAAMVLDGSWSVGKITDKENVIIIPFPAKKDEARQSPDMIGGFSMGFYITEKAWNNSEKQKAAVDFVCAMTQNDSLISFNSNGTAAPISARSEAAANPLLKSIASVSSEATAYINAMQDTMNLSARNNLFKKIPDIAAGNITIEEALKDFILLSQQGN